MNFDNIRIGQIVQVIGYPEPIFRVEKIIDWKVYLINVETNEPLVAKIVDIIVIFNS